MKLHKIPKKEYNKLNKRGNPKKMEKTIVIIGMVIGSYAGSCVPLIWGGSLLSMSSIMFGAIGGLAGIFVGYKISQRI